MKSFLHNNDTEMNGTHNNLSVAPERFIITLKNKIYKYLTSVSKHIYFDKLYVTVNKYNNTYHSKLK